MIPYRISKGKLEILLVTTSRRKRWVIPKGFVEFAMTPAASAVKEAREEAGVVGSVVESAIGSYEYRKWGYTCRVEVFPMQVEAVLDDWCEARIRKRQWMSVSKAIKHLQSPDLERMLETLKLQTKL